MLHGITVPEYSGLMLGVELTCVLFPGVCDVRKKSQTPERIITLQKMPMTVAFIFMTLCQRRRLYVPMTLNATMCDYKLQAVLLQTINPYLLLWR